MAAVTVPVPPETNFTFSNGHASPVGLAAAASIKQPTVMEKALEEDRPKFEIEEHPIDEVRPIKVGVIGAGLSGITAGVLLPAKLPGLDLRIYDKNADVVRIGHLYQLL